MNPFTLKIAKDQFTKNVKFDLVRYMKRYLTDRAINWKKNNSKIIVFYSKERNKNSSTPK